MADIALNPAGRTVTAEIVSRSLHVICIEITVIDPNDNTTEKYQGMITESSPVFDKQLANAPSAYSGMTATAVKQDIHAKIMMMNLCAGLVFPIEEKVVKEYREAKKNREVKHRRKTTRVIPYELQRLMKCLST